MSRGTALSLWGLRCLRVASVTEFFLFTSRGFSTTFLRAASHVWLQTQLSSFGEAGSWAALLGDAHPAPRVRLPAPQLL